MANAKENAEIIEDVRELTLLERIKLHDEQATNEDFESVGILDDYLGEGGIMKFNPRNLKRFDKDVIIDLYPVTFKVGDDIRRLVLGRGLSAEFRAKRVLPDHLLSMTISKRVSDDLWMITLEQAEGWLVSNTQLDKTKVLAKETFDIADFMSIGV